MGPLPESTTVLYTDMRGGKENTYREMWETGVSP